MDIIQFDSWNYCGGTYLYLSVRGDILLGNSVPTSKAIQIPSEATHNSKLFGDEKPQISGLQTESPLPVSSGEDVAYIFIDTLETMGYVNDYIESGADQMIEIKGIDGEITSAIFYEFIGMDSTDWSWNVLKTIEAASGSKEIETFIDAIPMNVYYQMASWNDEQDWSKNLNVFPVQISLSRSVTIGVQTFPSSVLVDSQDVVISFLIWDINVDSDGPERVYVTIDSDWNFDLVASTPAGWTWRGLDSESTYWWEYTSGDGDTSMEGSSSQSKIFSIQADAPSSIETSVFTVQIKNNGGGSTSSSEENISVVPEFYTPIFPFISILPIIALIRKKSLHFLNFA